MVELMPGVYSRLGGTNQSLSLSLSLSLVSASKTPCFHQRILPSVICISQSMASSSFILPTTFQTPCFQKSTFPGNNTALLSRLSAAKPALSHSSTRISAKFDLFQIMGGRGLCNGEEGLTKELVKRSTDQTPSTSTSEEEDKEMQAAGTASSSSPTSLVSSLGPEDAFEKELLGLTGGFPGGEKGLNKFIQENPPPPKKITGEGIVFQGSSPKKPKAPELPLLMPGMIVIVNNPNNPYYMYCGIIQRITDGVAGVLFEGGNWDKLLTFRLSELERRSKGPPMVNPKSAVLEPLFEKKVADDNP